MISFKKALFLSACIHALLILGYWAFCYYEPRVKLPPPSIQVNLSKLGEKRDQTLLPRIDAGPPPAAPKPAPHKTSTRHMAPAKPTSNPLDVLKKRFGKPDKSGNPGGSKMGSSLTSELADSYELQVVELLRDNYEIPRVISDKEATKLRAWVRIWIGPKGNLLKIKIEQPSKNPRFDQAVLMGSRQISSFGAPPLPLARKYRTEGLLIQFCPLECL